MKRPSPRRLSAVAFLALFAAARCPALAPSEWRHRQAVDVAATGLVRVELPPASLDAAGPRQEDLRLIDPTGQEVPFLLDRPVPAAARGIRPASFRVSLTSGSTEVAITTGTTEKLSSLSLETPSRFFLRAARVEISQNNVDWIALEQGVPIFREWGAEKLDLPLGGRAAAYVRVSLDDSRGAPLPLTGAMLLAEPAPAPPLVPVDARVSRRDEFAGETVLTLALEGRHLPLAALEFETGEPLFMRRVTVSVRDMREAIPTERTVASGTLFRVALDGAPARARMELPLLFAPSAPELLIHIYNGDSPPLALAAIRLKRRPVGLLFLAAAAGSYALLSGNPQAVAPHYDLAAFAGELRGATPTLVVPQALEDMPNYHPSESLGTSLLPEAPLTGAPLDATAWTERRAVQMADPGVQELELDLEALANSSDDFADLRLLRDGNQVPFVLEQPPLARSLNLTPEAAPEASRPASSIWKIHLPRAGLPLRSIALTSATALFQRQFRIFEKRTKQDGSVSDDPLASGEWRRTPEPGVPEDRVFALQERLRTDTLWIETDNGDNPAIALGSVQAVYPVVRLVFKVAGTGGLVLAYGNKSANAPRYDLNLVAGRLLTASRNEAHLSADAQDARAKNPPAGARGGYIFWGALALVVVVLLVVVAKLLPKPAA